MGAADIAALGRNREIMITGFEMLLCMTDQPALLQNNVIIAASKRYAHRA